MKDYTPEIFSLALVAVGYFLFTFLVGRIRSGSGPAGEQGTVRNFILQKVVGVVIYGIVPAALYLLFFGDSLKDLGLVESTGLSWIYILAVLIPVVVIIAARAARNPEQLKVYPLMRTRHWTPGLFLLSAAGWGAYIFSYEFLLRGLLLTSWLPLGIYTAILVNVAVYFLMHIAKGWREALSSVVFGIILCILAIRSGSFIPAFLLHVSLSIATEWFSIKYNPGMSFISKTGK